MPHLMTSFYHCSNVQNIESINLWRWFLGPSISPACEIKNQSKNYPPATNDTGNNNNINNTQKTNKLKKWINVRKPNEHTSPLASRNHPKADDFFKKKFYILYWSTHFTTMDNGHVQFWHFQNDKFNNKKVNVIGYMAVKMLTRHIHPIAFLSGKKIYCQRQLEHSDDLFK